MSPTLSHPAIRACQLAVATAAAAVLLSGCGGSQPAAGGSATSTAAAGSTAASSAAAQELSITDAWVKATDGAEESVSTDS